MRVLVADDSGVSRMMLCRMVESWGYEAVPCADGAEAWAVLNGPAAPRLAILDWVMPEMDGLELCRRLRAAQAEGARRTFVYLLTARSKSEDMLTGLDAGVDDYLTKPVEPSELRIRLRNGRRLVELHEELMEARAALDEKSPLDTSTRLPNRRAFLEGARRDLEQAERMGAPAGLVLVHPGELALEEAAQALREAVRTGDRLAYLGEKRFVVLASESEASATAGLAARLRAAVSAEKGAAIGVAILGEGDDLDALLLRADRALRAALRRRSNAA